MVMVMVILTLTNETERVLGHNGRTERFVRVAEGRESSPRAPPRQNSRWCCGGTPRPFCNGVGAVSLGAPRISHCRPLRRRVVYACDMCVCDVSVVTPYHLLLPHSWRLFREMFAVDGLLEGDA